MKEIIFKESNFEKVQKELDNVQKLSKARTVSIKDIKEFLEKAVEKLGIPKKYMNGISVTIDVNDQDFPAAYSYTPESTIIQAVYKNSNWKITDIYRGRTRGAGKEICCRLTDEAKEKVLDKYKYL